MSCNKLQVREAVLYPSLASATGRYDKEDRVVPRHQIISMGLFGIGDSPNPRYLPHLWNEHVHPEGNVYFVRNSVPKIVTELNVYNESVRDMVTTWLDQNEDSLTSHNFSPSVELVLGSSDNYDSVWYYLVDHARRAHFWFEDVSTEQLGLRATVSEAHLRHVLEEEYWKHVEYFPSHELIGFDPRVDDLFDVLLHGRVDQRSSPVSTIPFQHGDLADFTDILKTAQDTGRLHSPYIRWIIARLWSPFCTQKANIHYAEETCRLSRDQSIIDLHTPPERRRFALASAMTFGAARRYQRDLGRLYVDEIAYLADWRKFFASCHREWMLCVALSFALLLCSLVSFISPYSIQALIMLSIVLCNASILSGVALLIRHQDDPTSSSVEDAVTYLDQAKKPESGFENRALVLSLPRACLLWALGTFSTHALAGFMLWMWMQPFGYIAVSALVLSAVAYQALSACRRFWAGRSCSREEDVEAQIEVKGTPNRTRAVNLQLDPVNRGKTHESRLEGLKPDDLLRKLMTIAAPLTLRVPRKKALLIAVGYPQLEPWDMNLPGTHRDPITARDLLLDVYDWKTEDITILMDDGKCVDPTRDNIMQAMEDLVADAQSGDQFVFMFSGHGGQVPDENDDEEDGYDEVIWPLDIKVNPADDKTYEENYILDDDIHKILIDSLPGETRLVMLFDCCHSGTAADLECTNGDECPVTPVTSSKSNGRILGNTKGLPANYTITSTVHKDYTEEVDTIYSPMSRMMSKSTTTVHNKPVLPFVTSWSACKDNQLTIEDVDGCFIAAFARALRQNPNQTHSEMLRSVTREMEKKTLEANAQYTVEGLEGPFTIVRPQLGSLYKIDEIYQHPLIL
ncbi:hypothetical protein EIP91_010534 [Steccherinum ochraceum]|uniref:Peptidase C14 caspase domain-containing protein n=1 Tax=Steccherinum ochraceum TaxID=92696 RepID=A0A4R0R2P9_9APHY|nr:hypothetical protein EIP91_010534 [Steccherinum ochraceum]